MFIVSEDGRHALRIASIDAISISNYREGRDDEYWAIEARIKDRHFKLTEADNESRALHWRDIIVSMLIHAAERSSCLAINLGDAESLAWMERRFGPSPEKEKKAA